MENEGHRRQFAGFHEGIDVERNQIAGLERNGLACRRPVFLQRDQQLSLIDAFRRGFRWDGPLDRISLAFREPPIARREESVGLRSALQDTPVLQFQRHWPDAHIIGLAADQLFSRLQRRAALPALHNEGIARCRQRALAPIGRDQQRIRAGPGAALLGLRRHEPVFDELLGRQVKFAPNDGVLAAIRQGHHAFIAGIAALRAETVGPLVDPVLAFGIGQLVEVQNGFPFGGVGCVAFQRGAAPQAPDMRVILPEIVDHAVADRAVRNTLRRGQRFNSRLLIGRIIRVGLQFSKRALILAAHPAERGVAFHVFQPEIRILGGGVRGVRRRNCVCQRGLRWGLGSAGHKGEEAERSEIFAHGLSGVGKSSWVNWAGRKRIPVLSP